MPLAVVACYSPAPLCITVGFTLFLARRVTAGRSLFLTRIAATHPHLHSRLFFHPNFGGDQWQPKVILYTFPPAAWAANAIFALSSIVAMRNTGSSVPSSKRASTREIKHSIS